MGLAAELDRAQRRQSVLGFPIAVFYKYFDDQGNYLSAIITYYAFIAIFPLLLLSTSILGFVLQNDTSLAQKLLNSALSQFPIVGDELGRTGTIKGSVGGVIVGAGAALYGSLGLGQALQNAMNVAWSVPRNKRPNPIRVRLRSLALLIVGGLSVLVITVVSTLGTDTEIFGTGLDDSIRWLIRLATIVLLGGVLTLVFRLAAARRHHLGRAAPGAFVVAVLWQALQYIGTIYVEHVINETSGINNTFALVLGLLGIIFAAAIMGVLGMQVNVVLARQLWPRSLAAVFTDNDDLTEADLRAYAGYVRSQQHKQIENVEVTFTDTATGGIRIPQEALRRAEARMVRHAEQAAAAEGESGPDAGSDGGRDRGRDADPAVARDGGPAVARDGGRDGGQAVARDAARDAGRDGGRDGADSRDVQDGDVQDGDRDHDDERPPDTVPIHRPRRRRPTAVPDATQPDPTPESTGRAARVPGA